MWWLICICAYSMSTTQAHTHTLNMNLYYYSLNPFWMFVIFDMQKSPNICLNINNFIFWRQKNVYFITKLIQSRTFDWQFQYGRYVHKNFKWRNPKIISDFWIELHRNKTGPKIYSWRWYHIPQRLKEFFDFHSTC